MVAIEAETNVGISAVWMTSTNPILTIVYLLTSMMTVEISFVRSELATGEEARANMIVAGSADNDRVQIIKSAIALAANTDAFSNVVVTKVFTPANDAILDIALKHSKTVQKTKKLTERSVQYLLQHSLSFKELLTHCGIRYS